MGDALTQRFRLDDHSWTTDPLAEAARLVGELSTIAELVAEAQEDADRTRTQAEAWYATAFVDMISKKPKWPEWKVKAHVHADPKYRAHWLERAKADAEVTKLKGIAQALRRKAWFIGVIYNVKLQNLGLEDS